MPYPRTPHFRLEVAQFSCHLFETFCIQDMFLALYDTVSVDKPEHPSPFVIRVMEACQPICTVIALFSGGSNGSIRKFG